MSTEAQRNAANGSGNMFTMSADLSEISPVAPIARNGYAPFAESTPDTLVSTDPILAPSVNGLSLLPDGSTSLAGPLRVPSLQFFRVPVADILASSGAVGDRRVAAEYPGVTWAWSPDIGAWVPMLDGVSPVRAAIDYLAVIGQSVELGAAQTWVSGQPPVPVAFDANGLADPIPGAMSTRKTGSVWPFVSVLCASRGIKIRKLYNGAVGSTSMRREVNGCLFNFNVWQTNQRVYQERASVGTGDRGDKGDYINIAGVGLFKCVTGTLRYGMLDSAVDVNINGTNYTKFDYLIMGPEKKTGASAPNWASAVNVGDQVADGANVVWQLVSKTYVYKALAADSTDPFWDPLGVIARVVDNTSGTGGARRVVYLQNSQGDTYSDTAFWTVFVNRYALSFQKIAEYFISLGWDVFIGNSSGIPAENPLSNSYYPSQAAQQAATKAVTDLNNTKAVRGADWFALLGPDPICWPDSGTTVQGVHPVAQYTPIMAHDVAAKLIAKYNP